MTVQILLNTVIIALVVYLGDRFLPVRGKLAKALVTGAIASVALIFLPRFLP